MVLGFGGISQEVRRQTFCLNTFYEHALRLYNLIVIKMDIEGSEYEVLARFYDKIIPSKTPIIYIEFHDIKAGFSERSTEAVKECYARKSVKLMPWNALDYA